VEGEQTSVIELKVAKDDLGKIIEKQDQRFCNKQLDDRGHMTKDCHVRICGSVAMRFPRAIHSKFCESYVLLSFQYSCLINRDSHMMHLCRRTTATVRNAPLLDTLHFF
jgi:hypothetical protein